MRLVIEISRKNHEVRVNYDLVGWAYSDGDIWEFYPYENGYGADFPRFTARTDRALIARIVKHTSELD